MYLYTYRKEIEPKLTNPSVCIKLEEKFLIFTRLALARYVRSRAFSCIFCLREDKYEKKKKEKKRKGQQ